MRSLEVWTYAFPLSADAERKLVDELAAVAPLMAQARSNLVGNARDLWVTGIRDVRSQLGKLDRIAEMAGGGASADLREVIAAAKEATVELVSWLEAQADSKTGPSGIGRENYSWYQQNVHLVPLTWEDEVRLLKRELDRAWSSLKLEEQRNRELPPLIAADNSEDYALRAEQAVERIMRFFEEREILTISDYMRPALESAYGFIRSRCRT